MKILFVGGTGVISSACSEMAVSRGVELFLLNRGKSWRCAPRDAHTLQADINDVERVKKLIVGHKFDAVVDWIAYNEADVKRDVELFRDKTDQYIFISSASAYQKPPEKLPITEKTPLANPFWEYSRKKIACEKYLNKINSESGFPVTICRPSHTYDKTKVPIKGGYTFFHRLLNGRKIIIHDDGNSLWTLTHANDFAKGFIGLLANPAAIGEAFHITSDKFYSWNRIAEILAEKSGLELQVAHIPSDFIARYDEEWGAGLLGDKAHSMIFDNTKIKSIVPEFNAEISFEEGALEIAGYYLGKGSAHRVDLQLDLLMDEIINDYENQTKR